MMTLTKFGIREWGLGGVVTLAVLAGCWWLICRGGFPATGWIVAVIAVILFAGFAAFFRNPSRKIPADPALLVSPADGVVRDIGVVETRATPNAPGAMRR